MLRSRFRLIATLTLILLSLIAVPLAVVVVQNDFNMVEEQVRIPFGDVELEAVLALPSDAEDPVGLVIFVHGDGPVNASQDGLYRPIWESFAEVGYASLSWNKQGIDGAAGDWLTQNMADRALEVDAAIDWARKRPDIDSGRIGMWGASQAGWVMPKAAVSNPNLCFMIAVSPAISWLRQGRYNTLAELAEQGATKDQVDEAVSKSEQARQLLREQASYETYRLASPNDPDLMTERRWQFVLKNYTADSTEDLMQARIRTLLILAGHDTNVDVNETLATYEESLGANLEVIEFPDAVHSLVNKSISDSPVKSYFTAVFNPRGLFSPGFLSGQQEFLRESTKTCRANSGESAGAR